MDKHEQREIAIRLSGVKKEYRLGQIGGGTLQGDLQSWWARVRGREDPNIRLGQPHGLEGERFLALDGIDLTVYQGETLGIIGANGAGKSTLLKLLSRITAPTAGEIDIYGRVASMLEVGTGFHGEMTGRENIYMNGAILGMTRAEIDSKLDEIIEFSEVREFIDTPVKRYSSGMYVKLAFSVAAHLDSEIMIMDEVLAVGDMAFQRKCLGRMDEAARRDGRTVLYVSHNMSTIRQLCQRCILLDRGRITFDGDVEQAIALYARAGNSRETVVDFSREEPVAWLREPRVRLLRVELLDRNSTVIPAGEPLRLRIDWRNLADVSGLHLRVEVTTPDNVPQATYILQNEYSGQAGERAALMLELDLGNLAEAQYQLRFVFFQRDEFGNGVDVGFGKHVYFTKAAAGTKPLIWRAASWGYVRLPAPRILGLSRVPEGD